MSDALNAAMEPACGPVHINVQLGEPLTADFPELKKVPAIKQLQAPQLLPLSQLRELAGKARDRKVMVVAGFMTPSGRMAKGMAKLAALPNVVVLAESIANIHCLGAFNCVDRILAVVEKDNPAFQPDLVISAGGALVSRHLKSYLRNCRQVEHWSIGMTDGSADVFKHLSLKIKTDPAEFIAGFADALAWSKPEGNYAERWQSLRPLDERRHNALLEASPWSCMRLFAALWPLIPEKTNLQLSNGTCVRYAQLFHNPKIHASYCNRGVSGIDGCTSTAVGSALSYPGQTMLITGDMSFLYDSSPMLYTLPDRLKIIAIDNGGGGIFRFIRTTKNLPLAQREKYFCTDLPHLSEEPNLLARHTCFCAESEEEFLHFLPEFMKHEGPAIFLVKVDPELDARAITDYLKKHYDI